MKAMLIELFGWYGACAILLAYALVSFTILEPTNLWYQILNGTGALGIVAVSLHKRNYQPGALNLIWAAIAACAIANILL